MARLAQASNFATRAAKTSTLDLAQAHAGWADTLARSLGVSLESVAPSVWHDPGTGWAAAHVGGPAGPSPVEVSQAAQKAVALAQREKSTFTRADVIKYLGRVLPRTGMDPAAARSMLEEVADRALASEFEPVACLEPPELAQVRASLLRTDGRSVYRRHGGVRFATHAQLTMEQRMLALARAGLRPAPELARYDRITAERTVQPTAAAAETRDALAVLSGVLDRDGQQLSASQTRQQALADADHLAIMHAIWTDQTTQAREQHYRDLLAAHLPSEHRRELGHQARWLWRTLRAAELAGLDTGDLLAAAIGERDLAGARDLAAVIDARIRTRALVPASTGPWSSQVPAITDAGRRAYLAEVAALMDARQDRIGEHAAQYALPWAIKALGPVPDDPQDRAEWQRRAASIGAWRELSGHRDPADPIGPEPVAAPPPTSARPGTRPLPPSAPLTDPTSAACPTGSCCTCATPTPSRPPGRRNTSATSSARSAPPHPRPAWSACAPPPKPPLLRVAATTPPPPASRNSRPAITPCTRPTGSARPYSPRPWSTAPTGKPPPAPSATWLSPPTPNSAAATRTSTTSRSAPPNPTPPPTASAPNSPSPRSTRRAR